MEAVYVNVWAGQAATKWCVDADGLVHGKAGQAQTGLACMNLDSSRTRTRNLNCRWSGKT